MRIRTLYRNIGILLTVVALVFAGLHFSTNSSGAPLGRRTLQLSSAEASVTANYRLSLTYSTAGPVGSIVVEFCSNDPVPGTPCTAPVGFDASQASLLSQSGSTGFTVGAATDSNHVVLMRNPISVSPSTSTYELGAIVNPSVPASYYARIQTYASSDASGGASDYGGIAFAINNGISIRANVPPYLIFCTGTSIPNLNCAQAAGDFVNFGELSSSRASSGTSKMVVATNASSGYNITYQGGTLTSGNNEINAIQTNDVSRPGTSQFGLNLRANSTPGRGEDPAGPGANMPVANYNKPNFFRFASGDSLASYSKPDNLRQYTATYIANVPAVQAAGIYVSTITYICLANF